MVLLSRLTESVDCSTSTFQLTAFLVHGAAHVPLVLDQRGHLLLKLNHFLGDAAGGRGKSPSCSCYGSN